VRLWAKRGVRLTRLKNPNAVVIQALAQYNGSLHLGMEILSVATAQALTQHKGELELRGKVAETMDRIRPATSQALAQSKADLFLNAQAEAAAGRARRRSAKRK
jgi:hypothetical protein